MLGREGPSRRACVTLDPLTRDLCSRRAALFGMDFNQLPREDEAPYIAFCLVTALGVTHVTAREAVAWQMLGWAGEGYEYLIE